MLLALPGGYTILRLPVYSGHLKFFGCFIGGFKRLQHIDTVNDVTY